MADDVLEYRPEKLDGTSLESLSETASRELQRISIALEIGLARRLEVLHNPPARPKEGRIVIADGSDWNPGGGKGAYAYINGTWTKLS